VRFIRSCETIRSIFYTPSLFIPTTAAALFVADRLLEECSSIFLGATVFRTVDAVDQTIDRAEHGSTEKNAPALFEQPIGDDLSSGCGWNE